MYAASNNGMSIRAVDLDYAAQTGEVLFSDYPTSEQLASAFSGYAATANQQSIRQQIYALEATQTPRRMREFAADTDGGWLLALNNQITALRAQLT
jgi:hypothetical protein